MTQNKETTSTDEKTVNVQKLKYDYQEFLENHTYRQILKRLYCWSLEEAEKFIADRGFRTKLKQKKGCYAETNEEFDRILKSLPRSIKKRDDGESGRAFRKDENGNWFMPEEFTKSSKSEQEEFEEEFYNTTKIFFNDRVELNESYGLVPEGCIGTVEEIYIRGEYASDDTYFKVEFADFMRMDQLSLLQLQLFLTMFSH